MGRVGYEDDRSEEMGLLGSHPGGALESIWVHCGVKMDVSGWH